MLTKSKDSRIEIILNSKSNTYSSDLEWSHTSFDSMIYLLLQLFREIPLALVVTMVVLPLHVDAYDLSNTRIAQLNLVATAIAPIVAAIVEHRGSSTLLQRPFVVNGKIVVRHKLRHIIWSQSYSFELETRRIVDAKRQIVIVKSEISINTTK